MLNFAAAYLWLRSLKCFNFASLRAFNKFFMCNEHFIVIKFQIHLYIKIYTLKSWKNFTFAYSSQFLRAKTDSRSHFDETFVLVAILITKFCLTSGLIRTKILFFAKFWGCRRCAVYRICVCIKILSVSKCPMELLQVEMFMRSFLRNLLILISKFMIGKVNVGSTELNAVYSAV